MRGYWRSLGEDKCETFLAPGELRVSTGETPVCRDEKIRVDIWRELIMIRFDRLELSSADMKKITDYLWVIALAVFVALPAFGFAQRTDWKNLDLEKDTVFGISTSKAYDLVKGKKHRTVVVAVIDGGTDTAHEDLRDVLWVNPREKPGNGVDDDRDGYIDDVHGWDFIGGKDSDVWHDNLELIRLLREEAPRFDSMNRASISPADSAGYARYHKMKMEYEQGLQRVEGTVRAIGRFRSIMDSMVIKMGKDSPQLADWQAFEARTPGEQRVREIMIARMQQGDTYGGIVR